VRYRAAWLALVPNTRLVRMIELYADHMQHIRALTLGRPRFARSCFAACRASPQRWPPAMRDAAAAAVHEHLKHARQAFVDALGFIPVASSSHAAKHGNAAAGATAAPQARIPQPAGGR
jgi:hypothetical protein